MTYAIKVDAVNPAAKTWCFENQKTMYGGKQIAPGDQVFVFASENRGGAGLYALGVVVEARPTPRKLGVERQTPCVSITVQRVAVTKRRLGRAELRLFGDWTDGQPQTELNFKLYRQATNKIVGISEPCALFLRSFFD